MTAVDVGTLLAEGLAAHQAGRLADAEACYRRTLTVQPENQDALHLLGVALFQTGRVEQAVTTVRRALAAAPQQPTFWNTLGVAHQALGQLSEAAGSFQQAVTLAPEYADAWASLAAIHEQAGDAAAEAIALEQVTALQPQHARAWGRRGILAYLADRPEDALTCFLALVRLSPDDADAWANLGAVQLRLWRLADAEASQRRALKLRPDAVGAMNNLGAVLVGQSRWQEAAQILDVAVQRAPADPNGWLNFGHALKGLEQYPEALIAYDRALGLAPNLPAALIGRGDALQGLGDLHGAITCYEQARIGMPNDSILYEHMGVAYQSLGQLEPAIAAYRRCLELDPTCDRIHSGLIFALDLQEGAGSAAWDERMRWNVLTRERFGQLRGRHQNDPDPDRPLRIGYVSADFRQHSAGFLALPVLRSHDHARVQVFCYSSVKRPDQLTERFKTFADGWREVGALADEDLDALIRADQIDVLVDLSGHSDGNRLPVFAREPAPVQVTAWGYATGTGLDTMHYFLADAVVVPPETRRWYAEEVVNLPSLICYEPPDGLPEVAPPPSLTSGHVTFGAFNRLEKVTDGVRDAWAQIMATVPDAHLIVKTGGKDEQARQRLVDDLVARGVARDRITVRGNTTHREHLAAHNDIDILLDTFPHGGGVTSIEALLMGVPVVTVLGDRVAGRLAASFLTTLGLSDLVAASAGEYVKIVARLAADRDRLARERETLRARVLASPIADAGLYTRAVEDAYSELWRRWCAGTGGRAQATQEETL
ncbi:MAG: tetratricopeptide repeat protein [Chloroflexota bacterium]